VVHLPVKDSVVVPPQPHAPGPGATTRSLRILVIDHNHDTAQALAQILQITGHETGLAHDGLATLEAAASFGSDVVR
jgi:two-component system, chemotaxis family, CheB/CheR fusion protein